jgi:C-terminal processing protease CtpA/Prc
LARAVAIAKGELEGKPAAPADLAVLRPSERILDNPYPNMTAPALPYRYLSLFRFWNVIHYFFPYKDLLDHSWDDVLRNFIPVFEGADDERSYALAVAALVAQIQDTHGFVRSPALQAYLGTHAPPLRVGYVEDQPVVTAILGEATGAEIGDVIVEIDGQRVADRETELLPFLAHSTPQALKWRMASLLLGGPPDSKAKLTVESQDARREIGLLRSRELWKPSKDASSDERGPNFRLLQQGFGYMDLARLDPSEVAPAFELFRDTPAIIVDIRGYPKGTAWSMTPYFSDVVRPAAKLRRPFVIGPGDNEVSLPSIAYEQYFPAGNDWQYRGRIVILIDENAISHAEHSCLFLESAAKEVTYVGSPTNGANGNVTQVVLPGNIQVSFTGLDVRHSDDRQLQRRGIQPDIPVKPTIAGVRNGRDEVLDAAIEFLQIGRTSASR